ncbi:MAG: hypothetical protein FJX78_10335, partial [Armatimonadetes bacterium]|nr:hypothetical protein [Armatimonadota bacterium]
MRRRRRARRSRRVAGAGGREARRQRKRPRAESADAGRGGASAAHLRIAVGPRRRRVGAGDRRDVAARLPVGRTGASRVIAYLRGRVLAERDNVVVLECGGVGYEVVLPDAVAKALPAHVDPELHTLALYISYHVTANQLKPVLVGFLRQVEREFFERFITVDGLGPAKAIRAMTRPIHDIADAIERKDVAFLKRLPGLGERSAEKVIASLHG